MATTEAAPPLAVSRREVSIVRLVVLVLVVGALGAGGLWWAIVTIPQAHSQAATAWFAPYVDVTLTPTLHFEDPAEQLSPNIVLGFVVADANGTCSPSWGAYYDLDAASRALDLDRRIVRLRERGGEAVVSFGGASNTELATACTDVNQLVTAYAAVIDRYNLTTVDFDIEGAAVADRDANARRAAAMVSLQKTHPNLKVWLTMPVSPDGLTADGLAVVNGALTAGVQVSGVNAMTMDFGDSRQGRSMHESVQSALTATELQLETAYRQAGAARTPKEIWAMLGATPMIGINDVPGDVFTVDDAKSLANFAGQVTLGRLSLWSANRDVQCGPTVDDERASNTCSGVQQDPLQFEQILGGPLPSPTDTPGAVADANDVSVARDDPLSSPYPLWRTGRPYQGGEKVTWQGRVYQAKWWTQGDQPDAPVQHVWDTPWRYLGPVLASDREAVNAAKAVVNGTAPQWSPDTIYVAGDEVLNYGRIYKAKWWTQGEEPRQDPDRSYDFPWEYVGLADPTQAK